MFKYVVLMCLLTQCNTVVRSPNDADERTQSKLLLAFVVHRHGERSPDSDELSLYDNQEKLKNLTYLEGLEGLTLVGKRRAYEIGKFIRQRYGDQYHLISKLYLPDEIDIRTTEKDRTKMTAQVAMAAAYPPEPEQLWDNNLGRIWQPIPYTSLPLNLDFLRYYSNCKRFKELMAEAKKQSWNEEFSQCKELLPYIMENTGRNFMEDPLLFETLYDLFRSLAALKLDIPKWATPLIPRLSECARLGYRLYFKNEEMKKIGGGVLLNNFLEAANNIKAGKPVKKRLRIFSAHDFNIGSLMEVIDARNDDHIPEYGAVFALELYKYQNSQRYYVKAIYLPQAGESTAKTLRFDSCDKQDYCELQKFKDITKRYLLTESEYNRICDIKL